MDVPPAWPLGNHTRHIHGLGVENREGSIYSCVVNGQSPVVARTAVSEVSPGPEPGLEVNHGLHRHPGATWYEVHHATPGTQFDFEASVSGMHY